MEEQGMVEGLGSRRRLVQSTLFPQSVAVEVEEEDEDEEEWCESQENGNRAKGKSQKKRKSKATTPQTHSRASKKVVLSGRETPSKEMPDGDSPVTVKTDFFLKFSERKNQKRQHNEQLYTESPEKIQQICSPPKVTANKKTPRSKRKLANSTPEKGQVDVTARGKKLIAESTEACLVPRNLMHDESMSHSVPDLRMEARKTAEENSRIYVGKEIHPFFQSLRTSKKIQEAIDVESNCCSEGRNLTFRPVHVFDIATEDETAFDWSRWTFSEACALNTDVGIECGNSSLSNGSVTSLQFDNFPCISYPKKTSHRNNIAQHTILQDEVVFDFSPGEVKLNHAAFSIVSKEQLSHYEQLKNEEVVNLLDKIDSSQNNLSSSYTKQGGFLQERIVSDSQNCPSQPKSCLWTNKYQPEKAFQVCGNSEPVKILSDWLHLWHEKASRTSKRHTRFDKGSFEDDSDSLYESEADSTNDEQLKNVLLVSGPVGSGKSAAIYACAKEHGFQVIEVNASDWRNGALVKQRFGEAVESHWLQRMQKDPVYSEDKLVSSSGANEAIIPMSCEENTPNTYGVQQKQVSREEITANSHVETKTLILFEDVDTALCEDRGFVSTIQQLAETAKRPMILTSNSDNPVLPNNLDRLQVCFVSPSFEDLLALAHMVCAAEQVKIHPLLVDRFVDHCHGDIRKTIMYLQFWCQGQSLEKGNDLQRRYSPLQFDLDAGHLLLPKIIPWDFPSPLSELVDEEITKSMRIEESYDIKDKAEEDELNNMAEENNCRDHNIGQNYVDGKKEAMLSLLYSYQDHNEYNTIGINSELSDASESPIAFARRNTPRKLDRVMSSDSEDECSRVPLSLDQYDTRNEEIETACSSPSYFSAAEISCRLSTENLPFKAKRLKRNYLETTDYSAVNVVSKSVNISCVPEASIIPETQLTVYSELFSSTESCNDVDVKVEANYCGELSLPSTFPLEVEKLDETVLLSSEHQELQGCSSDRITNSIPVEVSGGIPSGYRVLDECSRIDFSKNSTFFETTVQHNPYMSVEETWRRLREGYLDLKQYVSQEQKEASQILIFANETCNLMSAADLLLADCNHLLFDTLEPSMIPNEESHSYTWHDDQLQMSSCFAQHGICFFTKAIASQSPDTASVYELDLSWEMLASTNSTMALGKLIEQNRGQHEDLHSRRFRHSIRSKANAYNLLQSAVPLRSHVAMKGDSSHEYLSSLSQISRFGTTRLLESLDRRKHRRARSAQHYLSSGKLALSQDDVSLLGQYNCYEKVSPGT